LDFTSTYSDAPCPPSEYDVLGEFDLIGRCGDCWCIPGDDGLDECPDSGEGITDTFDLEYHMFWNTFKLANEDDAPFLTLDEDCYPFADAIIDPIAGYPESSGPQCTKPAGGVCGYLFTEEVETCAGRPYEIVTYESRQAAEEAGAVVTHEEGGT
jgi:hypothetical protein